MVSDHGCEANPSRIAVTAIRNEEKSLATTTTMRTGEILAQVRNKARTSGVQNELPKAGARKRGLRRARTNSEDCKPPAIPTSLEKITIPQLYQVYEALSGRDPDKWLLSDSGYDKVIEGRTFVFGRESYAQWMSTVRKIFVDGTFRISPPLFEQVFVVLAKRNEYVFPIATALLPNKRAVTYRKFFQMLHDVFPQLNPQGVSCDYELAIQNAARGEWEGISIDGCYWHLCSNLYKHFEQEGLSARYDGDAQFAHEWFKSLLCFREYLQFKSSMNHNSTLDPINWLGLNDKSVPQQTNCCDCSVFVCQFAESASREIRPSFKQEDMERIRKQMVQEIQNGKLSEKKGN